LSGAIIFCFRIGPSAGSWSIDLTLAIRLPRLKSRSGRSFDGVSRAKLAMRGIHKE